MTTLLEKARAIAVKHGKKVRSERSLTEELDLAEAYIRRRISRSQTASVLGCRENGVSNTVGQILVRCFRSEMIVRAKPNVVDTKGL